jgi:hypothetical protein
MQVARRLQAMFGNLIALLPAYRHEPLIAERERLERAVTSLYAIPEDRALAMMPDSQGLGGAARSVSSKT